VRTGGAMPPWAPLESRMPEPPLSKMLSDKRRLAKVAEPSISTPSSPLSAIRFMRE